MTLQTKVPIQKSSIIDVAARINRQYNSKMGRDPNAQGVFGAFPFMSPKYARHRENRHRDYTDTIARMFIQIPPKLYTKFLDSLPDQETREIAKVLSGDNVSQGGKGYFDFLLHGANHGFTEKVQITETLADNYVAYFFGSSPPIWKYQGTVYNTYQDDWTMRLFKMYQEMARGTQLAKRGQILRLKYDSMIVSGAMMDLNWSLVAGKETACDFGFSLLVKSVHVIYGGLSTPTKIDSDPNFLPESFQDFTAQDAVQTDIVCSAVPEGVQQSSVANNDAETFAWEQSVDGPDLASDITRDITGTTFAPPTTVG